MTLVRSALALALAISPAAAQKTRLVSENIGGGTPQFGAIWPSLTSDGNLVVFESTGQNLAAGDANGESDVFLRDMQTGVTEIVSLSTSGAQGNAGSTYGRTTPDGRHVAFISQAQNFVTPNEGDTFRDVFLRDRTLGTTEKISVPRGGGSTDGDSYLPDLSDDGNLVVYQSSAANLVAVDGNGKSDVFLHDRSTDTTVLISRAPGGASGDKDSYQPVISGDGKWMAFTSDATDLVPGDTNARSDVFLCDLQTLALQRISVSTGGAQGNNHSREPAISGDGGLVIFASSSTNLVAGDTNGWQDIFARDTGLGTTTLISKAQNGTLANYSSFSSALSDTGQFATFTTGATNMTNPPVVQPVGQVRLDLATGEVIPVALSRCDIPLTKMSTPAISGDGSIVAFASRSTHVVPDDVNDRYDVFVHDPSGPALPAPCAYCNVAPTSNGCLPSISAVGTPSALSPSGFVLTVSSVEGGRNAMFIHGPDSSSTPWGVGGPSYKCVFHLGRFGNQNSGGTKGACDGVLTFDWNSTPNKWLFGIGDVAVVQAWFRDPGSTKTTHFSNALSFLVGP